MTTCECARCGAAFTGLAAFDEHVLTHDPRPVRQDRRRTCVITMANTGTGHTDVIRVCDPQCRDEFLLDLGLKGSGGGSAFRSHGEADVRADWNGKDYRVTWKRNPPSAAHCDLCEPTWRYREPKVKTAPAPTPAQLAARQAFASRVRALGRFPRFWRPGGAPGYFRPPPALLGPG